MVQALIWNIPNRSVVVISVLYYLYFFRGQMKSKTEKLAPCSGLEQGLLAQC